LAANASDPIVLERTGNGANAHYHLLRGATVEKLSTVHQRKNGEKAKENRVRLKAGGSVPNPSDGDCFFRALLQARGIEPTSDDIRLERKRIVDLLTIILPDALNTLVATSTESGEPMEQKAAENSDKSDDTGNKQVNKAPGKSAAGQDKTKNKLPVIKRDALERGDHHESI
jgi:hypothetical protein